MAKKPNATNITHGLAQLGGGSIKEGGGGMMQGVENIFKAGVAYGTQSTLEGQQPSENIEISTVLSLTDKEDDK